MKQVKLILSMTIAALLLLSACGEKKKVEELPEKSYTVKHEILRKTLYFSGTIEPIKKTAIASPAQAIIDQVYFTYGEYVKKGENLVQLNSLELQKNYNDTLTAYLKAKDQFAVAKAKFVGTQELFKAGLIAKNNYISERSTLENNRVSMIQSRYKLSSMLDKVRGADLDYLMNLDLSEIDKIKIALSKKYNLITLKATASGIMLYPPKGEEGKGGTISVGQEVKSGQVIGLIGNLSGLSLKINVAEVEIDKIKVGLPARVKGVAFPNQLLKGYVSSVNSQASSAEGASGGFPIFNAEVVVPNINKDQQKLIKVGMSASIEVDIETKDVLMVPIKAVFRKGQASMVNVKDAQGKIQAQPISTGVTSVNKVVVISGIKEGDIIVYK